MDMKPTDKSFTRHADGSVTVHKVVRVVEDEVPVKRSFIDKITGKNANKTNKRRTVYYDDGSSVSVTNLFTRGEDENWN